MACIEEYEEVIKSLKDIIREQNNVITEVRNSKYNEIVKANKFIDDIEDIYRQIKCANCIEHTNCVECIREQLEVKIKDIRNLPCS